MQVFTPEDLVLYLYEDTSPQQSAVIEQAIQEDWTLREKLNVLKSSMLSLDKIKVSPRTEVILEILSYSKEKNTEQVR